MPFRAGASSLGGHSSHGGRDEVRVFLEHWQIAVLASPIGFPMGVALLATSCLIPLIRLRLRPTRSVAHVCWRASASVSAVS